MCVNLIGFQSNIQIAKLLKINSVYFHPSLIEQWGLAINEACANSMPILVSENCGAVDELLSKNGWKFNPNSVDNIVEAFVQMREDKLNGAGMGHISLLNVITNISSIYFNNIFFWFNSNC